MRKNSGQSLVEILVGLSIGALLIGAASMAIAFVIRASSTNQTLATATQLSQDMMNKAKSFALSDWSNIYDLNHTSSSKYFLVASSTGFMAVPGEEGVIDNDIKNGLVGHWGFDEGTGTVTYDESGNGDNGTLIGGPTWQSTSTCKIGYCLGFNASSTDYVGIGDPASGVLDFGTGDFTVSAWAYTPILDTSSNWHSIVGKWVYSTTVNGWDLYSRYGSYYMMLGQGTGCAIMWGGLGAPVTPGVWQYISVTVQRNGNATMYLNGVQTSVANISSYSSCNLSNTYSFNIGARENGSLIFNGSLDDIRVYNRALSASEIKQLYNSNVFRRYFYVDNVCRSVSTTSTSPIDGNPPCGGSYFDDPSTQEITAVTEWDAAGKTSNFSLSDYVTRWSNFVFNQKDWSGGSGITGPFVAPANQYTSGTNVTTAPGSIQIQNLSQQ